jgi:hypothetical protein
MVEPIAWQSIVAHIIDVIASLGPESDRDLARPGMVEVRFGGRSRLVREEDTATAEATLRQMASADLGEAAARALPEPRLQCRGLLLPDGKLARANLDSAVRQAVATLRDDLVAAGDRVTRRGEAEIVDLTKPQGGSAKHRYYGLVLSKQEQRRYRTALAAADELLDAPRLSKDVIASTLSALRKSIHRKSGPHRRQASKAKKGLRAAAASLVFENPDASNRDIAKKVGVDPRTPGRWEEVGRARTMNIREPRRGIINDGQADALAD